MYFTHLTRTTALAILINIKTRAYRMLSILICCMVSNTLLLGAKNSPQRICTTPKFACISSPSRSSSRRGLIAVADVLPALSFKVTTCRASRNRSSSVQPKWILIAGHREVGKYFLWQAMQIYTGTFAPGKSRSFNHSSRLYRSCRRNLVRFRRYQLDPLHNHWKSGIRWQLPHSVLHPFSHLLPP